MPEEQENKISIIAPQEGSLEINSHYEEIKNLISGVDISGFKKQIDEILENKKLKEYFINELSENQPIKGGIQLRRIIAKFEKQEVSTRMQKNLTKEQESGTKEQVINTKEQEINTAIKENTQALSNLDSLLSSASKGRLNKEIDEEMKAIVSGNTDGETKKFLEDIGATDPEKLKDPKIQDILKARASTKIYLKNTKQLLDDNPSLKDNTKFNDSIKTLETNRSALGLSGSEISKNTGKLLNDIPKDPKEAIIGMVGSINKDSPNNTITRTGDKLTFADPKNEKYSYEIDVGKYPPVLTKRLGNISIDIQKVQDNPERKKKEQEYITKRTEKETTAGDINTDLKKINGASIHLDTLSKEELEMLTNSSIVERVQADIAKPLDNQTIAGKIAALQAEVSGLTSGGKSLDRSALLLAIGIYQSKLDIQNTGIGNITLPTVEEKDRMEKLNQIKTLQKSGKIEKFAKQKEEEERAKAALGNLKSPSIVKEGAIAESNLSFLADLGYDKLGQGTVDKIIASLNKEHPKVGEQNYIDLSREELTKSQKQEMLLAVTRLMGSVGRGLMPEWDNTDKNDHIIAYRQTRSPLWNTRLQDLEKKAEFKTLLQNPDIEKFQKIITGRAGGEKDVTSREQGRMKVEPNNVTLNDRNLHGPEEASVTA